MPRGEPKYTGWIPRRDPAPSALWLFTWPACLMNASMHVSETCLDCVASLTLGFRLANCLVTILLRRTRGLGKAVLKKETLATEKQISA